MTGTEEQVVYDVVNHFMSKGLMFTAFDVTKAVRKLDYNVKHFEVKAILKTIDLQNYSKVLKDISKIVFGSTKPIKALVYHPDGKDADNYNPVDLSDGDTDAISGNSSTQPVNLQNPDNVYDVSLDRRGRYFVRAKLVSEAGFGAGDSLYLRSVDSVIEISNKMGISDSILTVDRYKNFLLFEGYFMKAFGKVPSKIVMEVIKGKITITEYK
jgi:hypothetical protein